MKELYLILFIIVICVIYSFDYKYVKGGKEKIKNILIIDVANMYMSWKHDTGKKQSYLVCMDQYYKEFIKYNDINTCKIVYVIKNRDCYNDNTCKKSITVREWAYIHKFVEQHYNTSIAIAIDYSNKEYDIFKKKHYMGERDDYLCFFLARLYKRANINAVIMSNDKFKDFVQLGFVPPFEAIIIGENGFIEKLRPRINDLGQLVDFKMANISLDFSFDGKFKKDMTFKQKSIWI